MPVKIDRRSELLVSVDAHGQAITNSKSPGKPNKGEVSLHKVMGARDDC